MELTTMASPARARHGSYIFQRPGSPNWYVQLRSPDKRKVESLHTSDKLQAEIAASPMIAAHKAKLQAARPRFETVWKQRYAPRLQPYDANDEKIVASERELTFYNTAGEFLRTEPNGGRAFQLVTNNENVGDSNSRLAAAFLNDDGTSRFDQAARPTVAAKTGDDAIFDNYVKHGARKGRGLDGYPLKEATAVWELFRQLTPGKALKDCDRNDGRLLVAEYQKQKPQPTLPTIQKKINWLCAMVEFYNAEKKPDQPALFNAFSGIVPQRTVQEKRAAARKSLDDADVKACKAKLGTLSDKDQLLFRLLEATGMRLSEAFQIKSEEPRNGGPRFVIVGNKTENSLRRVPLPKSVLQHLPTTINAPLFVGDIKATSRRFTEFLRETVKIKDPKKVLYSLRHRAKDRARDLDFPEKIGEAIFGRDDGKDTGDNYGEGFAISKLKTYIDKISIL